MSNKPQLSPYTVLPGIQHPLRKYSMAPMKLYPKKLSGVPRIPKSELPSQLHVGT